MPQSTYIIRGEVIDFTRVDNLFASMKREAEKMLTNWTIDVEVKYTEKKGEKEK